MKLVSKMNRIDWKDNPSTCIRRNEVFECDNSELVKGWVDAGYVEAVMVKKTKTFNVEEKPTENTTPRKSTAKKV